MPRGGRRSGRPGVAHGNRTDLNKPPLARFTGQEYGAAAEQARSQAAIRPGPPPAPPPGQPRAPQGPQEPQGPPPTGGIPQSGPMPGTLGALDRPTERPGEPLTAGLPSGPGPGPEALAGVGIGGDALELQLRALYQKYPMPEIARLLEED